ncbi:hypothetical protein [Paraburkholderia sp.]|uniref:hypothetical protein n=1 Tax=Paraburkholderia sp. TaxID=1926495 RepID=UPI0039E455E5
MKHALILNLLIIAVVALALVLTSNPLAILALFMLRDLPYGLLVSRDHAQTENSEPSIGFTANL